jgi:hypothetical protein
MKKLIALHIAVLLFAEVYFISSAQSAEQKESTTVTTYYPSPNAVYRSLRLSSINDAPVGVALKGTVFFNSSDQTPYVHDGANWTALTGSKPFAYAVASPSTCPGILSNDTRNAGQLCSQPWQDDVTFVRPFKNKPHVMVFPIDVPYDVNSSCANNSTDQFIAYPVNSSITNFGFTMVAAGSVGSNDFGEIRCENASQPEKYNHWFTRALVRWFAISE